jgi:hypothetical protein
MKTTFCILVATLILTGCKPKPDARISNLEDRIAFLEDKALKDGENVGRMLEIMQKDIIASQSNFQASVDKFVSASGNEGVLQNINVRVAQIEWQLASNSPARPSVRRAAVPVSTVAVKANGVPAAVQQQIAADARRDWPTDYKMQEYVIESQTEAWLKLHGRQ